MWKYITLWNLQIFNLCIYYARKIDIGINFLCVIQRAIQNLQTSQRYIFHILQHFTTKLCHFTNFRMLFNAVVMNFPYITFFSKFCPLRNRSIGFSQSWNVKCASRLLSWMSKPLVRNDVWITTKGVKWQFSKGICWSLCHCRVNVRTFGSRSHHLFLFVQDLCFARGVRTGGGGGGA